MKVIIETCDASFKDSKWKFLDSEDRPRFLEHLGEGQHALVFGLVAKDETRQESVFVSQHVFDKLSLLDFNMHLDTGTRAAWQ